MPLNIDMQQILLHLFNFAILGGGLYFLLYKPVKDFMEKRTQHYREVDQEAAEKLKHAEQTEAEYKELIARADEEISTNRKKTIEDAKALSNSIIHDAMHQKEEIIAQAQEEAQKEREKAVQRARADIVELAAAAADKIMRTKEQSNDRSKHS